MWRSAARSIGACLALLCFFAVSSADPSPPSRADVTSGVRVAQRLIDTIPSPWRLDGDVRMAGDDAPVAQGNFVQASYALNKASLDSVATFSRAGNSMQFDSQGYLTYGPNNLLTYSNTFSNAAWTKTNAGTGTIPTLTSGFTDPLGGSNAWRLQIARGAGTTSGDYSLLGPGTISTSTNVIFAVYAKSNTGASQTTHLYDGLRPFGIDRTITTAWTLIYLSSPATGASTSGMWIGSRGGSDFAAGGDASQDILIYSAALSAVTYETTPRSQDQVITTSAAYYGPRIDYDPNTLAVKGLLIEEARTWVALWNRDFTNAAWTKASVTAAKDQSGIDGVANAASSLTATGANGTVLQSITLASSQRATSAYVKRLVGSGVVSMTTDGGATWTDITSQLGSGVYARATIPAQTVTNPSVGFKFATSGDSIAVDFFGNENGEFQTSALAVTTASVTRAADVVQFTGAAATAVTAAAGSLLVEAEQGSETSAYAGGTRYALYKSGNGATQIGTYNGSAILNSGVSPAVGSVFRAGLAWNAAGRSISANGSAPATDANTANLTAPVYLGSLGSIYWINGHIKSFAIYNQRLPDATLQSKSVVGASYAANDNGIRYAFADNDNLPVHWRVAL